MRIQDLGRCIPVVLVLLSALSGCSGTGHSRSAGSADLGPLMQPSLGLVNPAGNANSGMSQSGVSALLVLPGGGEQGGALEVLHEYQAASGRKCRRVRMQGESTVRVVCKRDDDQWTLTRALLDVDQGSGNVTVLDDMASERIRMTSLTDSTTRQAHGAGATLDAESGDSDEAMHDRLRDGESLWSFAARTTGVATNWKMIAEANGIDEPDRVRVGTALSVPNELLQRKR